MAATKDDLRRWFDVGVKGGASHMAVFMDITDYGDYPVYIDILDAGRVREIVAAHGDRLMEVYDLRMDREAQMAEHRAFHY